MLLPLDGEGVSPPYTVGQEVTPRPKQFWATHICESHGTSLPLICMWL